MFFALIPPTTKLHGDRALTENYSIVSGDKNKKKKTVAIRANVSTPFNTMSDLMDS